MTTKDTATTLSQKSRMTLATALAEHLTEKGTWSNETGLAFCKDARDGNLEDKDLLKMHFDTLCAC